MSKKDSLEFVKSWSKVGHKLINSSYSSVFYFCTSQILNLEDKSANWTLLLEFFQMSMTEEFYLGVKKKASNSMKSKQWQSYPVRSFRWCKDANLLSINSCCTFKKSLLAVQTFVYSQIFETKILARF